MAKRKRLTPARPGYLAPSPAGLETKAMSGPMTPAAAPPIAQVAREAASTAALEELTGAVQRARDNGLIVQELPLAAIDAGHLVRDRLALDPEEMAALEASLSARGQQAPIEVVPLPEPRGEVTHGLISGWRRLMALRALHARTGEARFATVRAMVMGAETAQDAYVAMVEENEIRVNLSLYERAHIALRAVEEGVFPTEKAALLGLYASVTRSKRSKIGSFLVLVRELGRGLRFGPEIPEKLGLPLARRLEKDAELGPRLLRMLRENDRIETASHEQKLLARALARAEAGQPPEDPVISEDPRSEPDTGSDRAAPPPAPRIEAPKVEKTRYDITGRLNIVLHQPEDGEAWIEMRGAVVGDRLLTDLRNWLYQRDNSRG